MRYFVTGATGFIGSHLVDRLVERGDEVVALVRTPESATALSDAVEVVQGDITDKDSMREAMATCDRLYHLAAWYEVGVRDRTTAYRVNVEGTRNTLELMQELGIEKGVYTSTVAVFSDTNGRLADESYRYNGPHLTVYDETKWLAQYEVVEPMIEDGLPLVLVQPGAVYGPGDRGPLWMLWKAYLQGDLPFVPKQTGFCWGHVEDTVAGHLLAMEAGDIGESYIIAGEPYRLVDILELAEEVTGIPAPRAIHPVVFRALARLVTPLERFVSFPVEYRAESLRIFGGVTYWGDNEKAVRSLGLEHRPVSEGLRDMLEIEQRNLAAGIKS